MRIYGAAMAGVVAMVIVATVIGLAIYILTSKSISEMCKRNGMGDKRLLAWIPIVNIWLLSLMIGDIRYGDKKYNSIILIVAHIAISYLNARIDVVIISVILSITGAIIIFAFYNELFRRFPRLDNSELWAIAVGVVPFLLPILLYINRFGKLEVVEEIDYKYYVDNIIERFGGDTGKEDNEPHTTNGYENHTQDKNDTEYSKESGDNDTYEDKINLDK